MDDILLHELAHHLQHSREPGSSGDHGEDFFRAIFDVVIAHYRHPIEYDWFFDFSAHEFADRLRPFGIDL
jgi:hypothetical protein